ncbi:alpha/beta-hydrolase [Polychaeton citri CBS 116435]|uniref:Alpha/beta-hydrolase n=1 Tax=Polychaeton citri CBS 116435 TaxID=1314669 RepID=A0A9P4Q3R9_9PEZI|nr:alpha/beta-hydrolase [Polychaeton citri CBS 116435]
MPPQLASGEPTPDSELHVTERTERSLMMHIMQLIIKPINGHVIKPRKIFPPGSPQLTPPKKVHKRCDVQERQVDDMWIYDIVAKRVYYFAGGGWQMAASSEHWALMAELACRLPNTTVSLISYPLAPKSPAPVTFVPLERLYLKLLEESATKQEKVILAGDSAGGNIALCLATSTLCASEDCLAPEAIFVLSPSTDLRRHNPQIKVIEKHDPLLKISFINSTAKAWWERWDPGDPRVSPIRADLKPLARKGVKVHGVTGTYDILAPDAILFREKCRAAGIGGEWLSWDKQMHCFPLAFSFKFKESVQAVDWIVDVMDRS